MKETLWDDIKAMSVALEELADTNKRLSEENEILRADLRSATSQLHEIDREYQRIWAELQGMKEPDTNPTTRTYPDAITP